MKTKAVRLYGVNDLVVEEFELPKLKEDDILIKIITDSVCMSTHKATMLGSKHKRVPETIEDVPIIVGHEFSGEIVEVGEAWQNEYKAGQKFVFQPVSLDERGFAPGYSCEFLGGDSTYSIMPREYIEAGALLRFDGSFFEGSLSEPMSCIIGAFHSNYHTEPWVYKHKMGPVSNGNMALLASAGPMGLGAIDYALNGPYRPKLLVVTDVDEKRLKRADSLFDVALEKSKGTELHFINTKDATSSKKILRGLTNGHGYDDVFVFAPVKEVVELADQILGIDGCLNFFAGPTDKKFSADLNFYNVHYESTHVVGTSGGNKDDMKEALTLATQKKINPAIMVTHIGGLNCVPQTVLDLPNLGGGKKMIYPHIEMELTAIEDFEEKSKTDPLFLKLAEITAKNNGLWSREAEQYLISNFM